MEIIMKVKYSPSPGAGSSPHSSLKIVDHHHQLQQHTYSSAGYKSSPPPPPLHNAVPPRTYTPNTGSTYAINSSNTSSCNDCSLGYCCNISSCCVTTPPPSHHSQTPPQLTQVTYPASSAATSPYQHVGLYTNNSSCQPTDEPEFVSIEDEKVKQYLIRLGQEQLQKQRQQQQQHRTSQREPKITHVISAPTTASTFKPVIYEIIELDDEDEREKLKQIKQQAEQSLAGRKLPPNLSINFARSNTKSLDISLIPKTPESITLNSSQQESTLKSQQKSTRSSNTQNSNHRIIAEIDLIDSDDDVNDVYTNDNHEIDDEDDDEALPLVAVSCELQCDEEDEDITENNSASTIKSSPYKNNYLNVPKRRTPYSKPMINDVVIVRSQGYKNSDDMLVRWEEFDGQRERVFFECFLCGKKVQSSYNLRRHMMIHTGERPFGCDLCDRRFREFSDMKKHRRRHSNEPKYLCMVCHEREPVENDPTRCINCCTKSKNVVIMAAMKPATEADKAAEENARIKTSSALDVSQPTVSSAAHSPRPQQTLPTITSVTSFNIAEVQTETPPPANSPAAVANSSNNNNNNVNSKTSEETQRFLDNIPAVHRPGYNELGIITRKEFPCPLCNRAFGTRHNLKRHYMIHTGEKPFSCSVCRKPFREYSTLKKHMVTHIRERWYKCMRCPMKSRDFIKYTEHKQTHSNDSDSEEVTIRSGSPSALNSMQVDGYMDSNDEDSGTDDWLECCECGQRFNEIDTYNEHLKEHDTNSQIFQCYICKVQLISRIKLDQHIKQKHKLDINDSMEENSTDKEDEMII